MRVVFVSSAYNLSKKLFVKEVFHIGIFTNCVAEMAHFYGIRTIRCNSPLSYPLYTHNPSLNFCLLLVRIPTLHSGKLSIIVDKPTVLLGEKGLCRNN